jgi:hypothetical protein
MRLGVDFGTSHTVAVLSRSDGRADPLLFDSSPLLPSAVFADPGGALLTGRDAERSARLDPAAFEPHPKRRIDDVGLFLGGRDVPVVALVEAVLRRVAEEAVRTAGRPVESTVLTHPAGWGPPRREQLLDAAARAGLPAATLVPEPVAAAMYFTRVLGHHVPDGHALVVYDFGGGTFDISVVRRAGAGWEVVAAQGLDDVGGIDLDAAIVGWAGGRVAAGNAELWRRLENPATAPDRRHRRALWDDARSVKELLSRANTGGIAVPIFDVDLHLTRAEFEHLARPWLDRTVTLTTATLFTSGVSADRLAGVFLVGGASRVPLVATLLHRALGVAPVILEQPELVVALGSLLTNAPAPMIPAVKVPEPAPVTVPFANPVPPPPPPPVAAPPPAAPAPKRRKKIEWTLLGVGAVVALGLAALLVQADGQSVLSGFFTPLTPKPVLVLLAMTLTVAATGRAVAPAYRALAPALLATGGAVLMVFFAAPLALGDDGVPRLAGGPPVRLVAEATYFGSNFHWFFLLVALAFVAGGGYLLARPPRAGAIEPPPPGRARWRWAALWAAAGAALVLASNSTESFYQREFGDGSTNVSPMSGINDADGALSWFPGFALGLLMIVGSWLLAGAALRPVLARNDGLRRLARWLALASGAGLIFLWAIERFDHEADRGWTDDITDPYWHLIQPSSSYWAVVWVDLVLAIGVGLGVAVPSYLRARRAEAAAGGGQG